MPLDTAEQAAAIVNGGRHDNTNMLAPRRFPDAIQGHVIDHVEGQDRPAVLGCVTKLVLVGDRTIGAPDIVAAHNVVPTAAQGVGQPPGDHLVGVKANT